MMAKKTYSNKSTVKKKPVKKKPTKSALNGSPTSTRGNSGNRKLRP